MKDMKNKLAKKIRSVFKVTSCNPSFSTFLVFLPPLVVTAALMLAGLFYFRTGNIQGVALFISLVPGSFLIIRPIVFRIGLSQLDTLGISVKSREVLEKTTQVDTLCFVKTGVLTQGNSTIIKITPLDGITEEQVLQAAMNLESLTEHHLGRSISQLAFDRGLGKQKVSDFRIRKGLGVSGVVDGITVLVGNKALLKHKGVPVLKSILATIENEEDAGALSVYVAVDSRLIGLIFVHDYPRMESKNLVKNLKILGYHNLFMITGNEEKIARKFARDLGLTQVRANLLPQDKANFIKRLKNRGHHVLLVGGDLDDSSALAEAHVGVSMGVFKTESLRQMIQVKLLNENLEDLSVLLYFGRRVYQVILMNFIMISIIYLVTLTLVLTHTIGVKGSVLLQVVSLIVCVLYTYALFCAHRANEDLAERVRLESL